MLAYRQGDVVRLKSGGPDMTVTQVSPGGGRLECVWFHEGQRYQQPFLIETIGIVRRAVVQGGEGIPVAPGVTVPSPGFAGFAPVAAEWDEEK